MKKVITQTKLANALKPPKTFQQIQKIDYAVQSSNYLLIPKF